MKIKYGLSLIEILLSLAILSGVILVVFGVIAQGLIGIKKGKNISIASNLAIAQFEVYKDKFYMLPFYPGTAIGNYRYPDKGNSNDSNQIGKFVNHTVNISILPSDIYLGADGVSEDFYHNAPAPHGNGNSPYYDLNHDGYPNDIIEPLPTKTIDGTNFTPVVEIKPWNNGFNINQIKHLIVTVYWKERDAPGVETSTKHISFEGFISRNQSSPW